MNSANALITSELSVVFSRLIKAAEKGTATFSGQGTPAQPADSYVVPSAPTAPVSVSTDTPEAHICLQSLLLTLICICLAVGRN